MSDSSGKFERIFDDIRESTSDALRRLVDESQRVGEELQTRYRMWEVRRSMEREHAALGQLLHQMHREGKSLDVSQDPHCAAIVERLDRLQERFAELESSLGTSAPTPPSSGGPA